MNGMSGARTVPGTVDAAVNLVSGMSPAYVALLALASLPWRFGVAVLAGRAFELGAEAANVAPYWAEACGPLAVLFSVHVFAQLIFVRAAFLTVDEGEASLRPTFKGAGAAFPAVLYVAAVTEAAFFLSFITMIPAFFLWALSGMVLGGHTTVGTPSLRGPWKALAAERELIGRFVALHALLFLVFLVVLVNLAVLTELLPGLLGLIPGFPVETVLASLSRDSNRVGLGLWAMSAAVIEPVRLAACTLLCFERTAQRSGRDLRARLRALRTQAMTA